MLISSLLYMLRTIQFKKKRKILLVLFEDHTIQGKSKILLVVFEDHTIQEKSKINHLYQTGINGVQILITKLCSYSACILIMINSWFLTIEIYYLWSNPQIHILLAENLIFLCLDIYSLPTLPNSLLWIWQCW